MVAIADTDMNGSVAGLRVWSSPATGPPARPRTARSAARRSGSGIAPPAESEFYTVVARAGRARALDLCREIRNTLGDGRGRHGMGSVGLCGAVMVGVLLGGAGVAGLTQQGRQGVGGVRRDAAEFDNPDAEHVDLGAYVGEGESAGA
jgi:hypothetical protein